MFQKVKVFCTFFAFILLSRIELKKFCFSRILIIGDSNLVRLEPELGEDRKLLRYIIELMARPGFRASFLWANESLFAKQFTHVIIMCGNNDIGVHPRNDFPTETPLGTACRLIAFHNVLREAGLKVAVVGLMFRLDFLEKKQLVLETNEYLKKFLMTNNVNSYVGPRLVQSHYFDSQDPAHLNERGRRAVRALLLNKIKNRFSL